MANDRPNPSDNSPYTPSQWGRDSVNSPNVPSTPPRDWSADQRAEFERAQEAARKGG